MRYDGLVSLDKNGNVLRHIGENTPPIVLAPDAPGDGNLTPCVLVWGDELAQFEAFTALSAQQSGLEWKVENNERIYVRGISHTWVEVGAGRLSESVAPSNSTLKRTKLRAETELAELQLAKAKTGVDGQEIWKEVFLRFLFDLTSADLAGVDDAARVAEAARAEWQKSFQSNRGAE